MEGKFFRKPLLVLSVALIALLAGYLTDQKGHSKSFAAEKVIEAAKRNLSESESTAIKFLEHSGSLVNEPDYLERLSEYHSKNKSSLTEHGLNILLFKNGELKYWSGNEAAFDNKVVSEAKSFTLITLENGWYEVFKKTINDKSVIVLLLIKNDYSYTNKFLENKFNHSLNLPSDAELSEVSSPSAETFPIESINGKTLFFISLNSIPSPLTSISQILYIAAIFLICIFIHLLSKILIKKNKAYLFFLLASVLGARLLMIYFEIPSVIYQLPLFNPQYYASSFFLRSLGDLMLNAVMGCYFAYLIHRYFKGSVFLKIISNPFYVNAFIIINLTLIFILIAFINSVFKGLILNSQIPFNINNIFELNEFSFIGIIVFCILFFLIYLVVDGFLNFVKSKSIDPKRLLFLFLIGQGIFLLLLFIIPWAELYRDYTINAFAFSSLLIASINYIKHRQVAHIPISRYLFIIFVFSVYAARIIYVGHITREQENRKVLARKLENEQDPVAEYLFKDIENEIKDDQVLASYFIGNQNAENVIKRLHQFYLKGYWNKYESKIYCFDVNRKPLLKSLHTDTINYFEDLIKFQASPTASNLFYFLNNDNRISYLAKIPITSDGEQVGTVFIEINSKFVQESGGFPELLLSGALSYKKGLEGYSYAQYIDNQLVAHYGNFNYLISPDKYKSGINETSFRDIDNYNHLFYKAKANKLIIVSKDAINWIDAITLFSYLFAILCIFTILILLLRNYSSVYTIKFNFATRIQAGILSIVVISLIAIGCGMAYSIYTKYSARQIDQISERIETLAGTVENLLNELKITEKSIGEEEFSRRLSEVSNTDLNIYDAQGTLIFSTQPKITEQGILSSKMNAEAFFNLALSKHINFIHSESIGKLNFIASYVPLRNDQGAVTGFLNMPYFAKQTELKREISSFLLTLINLYVLLLAMSILVAVIISNYITQPLKLIQEKLAHVKLGKKNELIQWDKQDEIGSLIAEYNRMVDELSRNAELLAKSERESAWREMAKQVAHEIKNPLTPMKLSLQHLQRAWNDQSPDIDKILKRISNTLVEQIDTLASIATAFSNFAQMPRDQKEILDLKAILKSITNLFSETENILLTYSDQTTHDLFVNADKDQLSRVFTNLIKNAIQAIPESRTGIVDIKAINDDSHCIISVRDNGSGIAEDQLDKIFSPNFTTKTSGMGLGLAMSKSSIENAEGKIWFETVKDEGTVFFVKLPLVKV